MAKYKIRNAKGRIDGPFTEKDVLSKIQRGRIGVDDEISVEPWVNWEKISGRPEFYDVFLRRLFSLPQGDLPEVPSSSKPQKSISSPRQKFTQQDDSPKTRAVADENEGFAGTRNIVPEGGTVHQSEIDELFSEVA